MSDFTIVKKYNWIRLFLYLSPRPYSNLNILTLTWHFYMLTTFPIAYSILKLKSNPLYFFRSGIENSVTTLSTKKKKKTLWEFYIVMYLDISSYCMKRGNILVSVYNLCLMYDFSFKLGHYFSVVITNVIVREFI